MSRLIALGLLLATSLVATSGALGADYRVDSKVFVGKQAETSASNLTLFQDKIVYDFAAREVTVFDKSAGRFVLLDTERKLKTEVTTDELLAYSRWIRREASEADDPLLRFSAVPHFKIEKLEADNAWRFGSKTLTYRAECQKAPQAEQSAAYREFCDWFARLNAMTNPSALPPFARMAVNAHLEQNAVVPEAIHLNIAPHERFGGKEFYARSTHDFRWGLTESDIAKIEQAQRDLVQFRVIPLKQYRENLRGQLE